MPNKKDQLQPGGLKHNSDHRLLNVQIHILCTAIGKIQPHTLLRRLYDCLAVAGLMGHFS